MNFIFLYLSKNCTSAVSYQKSKPNRNQRVGMLKTVAHLGLTDPGQSQKFYSSTKRFSNSHLIRMCSLGLVPFVPVFWVRDSFLKKPTLLRMLQNKGTGIGIQEPHSFYHSLCHLGQIIPLLWASVPLLIKWNVWAKIVIEGSLGIIDYDSLLFLSQKLSSPFFKMTQMKWSFSSDCRWI